MSDEKADEASVPDRKVWKGALLGAALVAACHLVFLVGAFFYPPAGIMFVFISAAQFVYVLPLIVFAVVKKRNDILRGVIIAAAITVLLNAACFGVVFLSFKPG